MEVQAVPAHRPDVAPSPAMPPSKWHRAVALPSFRELLALKRQIITPMLVIYLVYFLGVMLLAGYARPLMSIKVLGPLNLGYALIIGTYLMCWALAVLYALAAGRLFDRKAAQAVAEFEAQGSRS